jgi:hypothetical protein
LNRVYIWAAAALAAIGLAVLSNAAIQRQRIRNELSEAVEGRDRYVDAGIRLHVVVADPNGEVLVPKAPPLRILRTHHFGGLIDTSATPAYVCGPSRDPVDWYCSEGQEPIIIHDDDQPPGEVVVGSEGSGKTTALAMWHALRWLEHLGEGREGLQTAPIGKRLDLVRREMVKLWRPSWYRYRTADGIFEMCDGSLVRMISTYRQSEEQGSPIQGFNSSWAGADEAQDQVEVHEDIESRGRAAKIVNGEVRYKQLRTATAKHSSAWKTLRDKLEAARMPDGRRLWTRRTLLIADSPFIAPSFLVIKAQSMSEREFRRRYWAADLPPELATYPAWIRAMAPAGNLIRIPDVGWEDVTEIELAKWGLNLGALCGHDPGNLWHVTLFAKAYRVARGARPIWVVRDEISTERSTAELHVAKLLERVRSRWGMNLLDRNDKPVKDGPRIFVRADPYGNSDKKPDRSTYTIFRNAGIKIEPAAYSVNGGAAPGRVPKDAGIEVVNTLLCSAAKERRLFVEVDEHGAPVAPKLVEALESEERDYRGTAETAPKNEQDRSHWPAALRYLLWAVERPRLQLIAGGRA